MQCDSTRARPEVRRSSCSESYCGSVTSLDWCRAAVKTAHVDPRWIGLSLPTKKTQILWGVYILKNLHFFGVLHPTPAPMGMKFDMQELTEGGFIHVKFHFHHRPHRAKTSKFHWSNFNIRACAVRMLLVIMNKLAPCGTDGRLFATNVSAKFKVT